MTVNHSSIRFLTGFYCNLSLGAVISFFVLNERANKLLGVRLVAARGVRACRNIRFVGRYSWKPRHLCRPPPPPMRVYDYLDSYPDGNCPGLFVRFASRIWPSFFAVENAFADCRLIFAIPPGIIRKIKTTGERDVAAFRRHP